MTANEINKRANNGVIGTSPQGEVYGGYDAPLKEWS